MVKEARNISTAGANRAHSDGGSRKNKHSNSVSPAEGRISSMKLIFYGSRYGEKLL